MATADNSNWNQCDQHNQIGYYREIIEESAKKQDRHPLSTEFGEFKNTSYVKSGNQSF